MDYLIASTLLLDCVRRQGFSQITSICDIYEGLGVATTAGLYELLRLSLPHKILRALFNFHTPDDNTLIPPAVLEGNWENRITDATWFLVGDKPMPLCSFGDFHQLCITNPLEIQADGSVAGSLRYERGIHYTPAPIVDYLTCSVLQEALAGKTIEELRSLRILDPSCGCGAFLIASARYLFRWLEKQHAEDHESSPLTVRQRVDLVGNVLFGTDIDEDAVAWTKRLLLLTFLEMIPQEVACRDAVPVSFLDRDVVCRDFLTVGHSDSDGLPKCFDVILGGPPFVRLAELRRSQRNRLPELRRRFQTARFGQFDLYMLFIEQSLELLANAGHLGFSLSNTVLRSRSGAMIRKVIMEESHIREIVEFDDQRVYPDATTQIAILTLTKSRKACSTRYVRIEGIGKVRQKLHTLIGCGTPRHSDVVIHQLSRDCFSSVHWSLTSVGESEWLDAVKSAGVPLGVFPVIAIHGIHAGADDVFIMREAGRTFSQIVFAKSRIDGRTYRLESGATRSIMRGRYVRGFGPPRSPDLCVFPYDEYGNLLPEDMFRSRFPLAYQYLLANKTTLINRRPQPGVPWYATTTAIHVQWSRIPMLICGAIDSGAGFTIIEDQNLLCHESIVLLYAKSSCVNLHCLLGILNSRLFWKYVTLTMPAIGRGQYALRLSALRRFPIPAVRSASHLDATQRIAGLVRDVVKSSTTEQHTRRLRDQLDREVEALYGIGLPDGQNGGQNPCITMEFL